ncbi:MAG: LD-carboxypeptidase [Bacteroidetes bacterium]|nr:MAG: LD-carboxypeptidase [Bacteroidota bacterium]
MKNPENLKKGDIVSIVAPAGKIDYTKILNAQKYLEILGLKVITGENINKNYYQFSAKPEQRLLDFQQAINDKNIKAIFCARGGYGSVQIINKLDFTEFIKNPKWIIGYSDITVLHSYLNTITKTCSIHGTMPINYPENLKENESLQSLRKLLFGEKIEYKIKSSKENILGNVQGELIGGNLSILYSLRGTPYDIDTNNKILFIEDVSEYLYNIDRIMYNLKLGGKLAKLKALIVGSFTDIKDNEQPFGMSVKEIILDSVKEYNFPVIFDFPAGHQEQNYALKFGCDIKIISNKDFISLSFL